MEVYVGTSGWFYSWNPERSLDWYVQNSGLNAIELNASFYRFPFPNQIKSWANKGKDLFWAVKVNRLVTHVHKFSKDSERYWENFEKLFQPLDPDVFLFQLPPSISFNLADKIQEFFKKCCIDPKKIVLEGRHLSWFTDDALSWAKKLKICLSGIDAPGFGTKVIKTSDTMYFRFHGRTSWYSYNYSMEELSELANKFKKIKPKKIAIFFNNDHDMLSNARMMHNLMK
ncbi:MAG: DUF72 domain-containing protein [archaeon]